MIVAGDVGGTKINLALFEVAGRTFEIVSESGYLTKDYPSFQEVIADFLGRNRGAVTAAAFGIPGPVVNGRAKTTNLQWTIDSRDIAPALGLRAVGLINDLQATAYGILRIPATDICGLNEGEPREHGTIGVIAAGTGLGEGALMWDGGQYRALASEGGHTDFGPRDDLEIEMLRFFRGEFGRVSYERIVSGPGLQNLYRFFRSRAGYPEPAWLTEEMKGADPSAVISQAGLAGTDRACEQALDTFVSVYGAEAGNLALKALSTAGMYVGGGIAPKILSKLKEPLFLDAFRQKGRYASLLRAMPLSVILNQKTALYGAAHYALMMQH